MYTVKKTKKRQLDSHKRSSVGTHLAHNCSTRVGVCMHVKRVFLKDAIYIGKIGE